MRIRKVPISACLCFAVACQNDTSPYGDVATSEAALTPPASLVRIETGYLVKGLSTSTYRDVASSSTNYYVLTSTGVKRVTHADYATIPAAPHWKSIGLQCIDYVNSTWNLVGARNKSGTTPAQLVLKIENATPTTVNLPSDVTTVYDIEAKPYSSTALEIWVTTNLSTSKVIREFRYNGTTLTAIRQIPFDSDAKTGITAKSISYLIGARSNSGYPAFYKKYTTSPYASLVENQLIEIDHGPIAIPGSGDYSPGTTSGIYSHGYDGSQMGMLLFPEKVDWATRSNGTSHYVMLNATGSGAYDMVSLDDGLVQFQKTPARDFAFWNDRGYVEGSNNCYNYAANRNTMNFAQPGYGSGQIASNFTPSELIAAATRDGLEFVPNPGPGLFPTVPEGKTLTALITGLAPSYTQDYHWFRRDRDGKWTAKPGACEATDLAWPFDDVTKTIVDPRTTPWDPAMYDTFVGFFLVDSNYEQGLGRENIGGSAIMREQLDGCEIPHSGTSAAAMAGGLATSTEGAADASPPLKISVMMYSGRENPSFEVSDVGSIEQIRMAFRQSSLLSSPRKGPKVGPAYMGLSVENTCGVSGLPKRFRIFQNQLESFGDDSASSGTSAVTAFSSADGGRTHLADTTGALESYLLDQALSRGAIDSRTRQRIRNYNGK